MQERYSKSFKGWLRVDLNTLYLLLLYWNYKLALSFLLVKTFFLQKLTKLFVRKMMLSFLWSQVLGDVKFCSILTLSFVWRSSFACQVSCGHWTFVWMSSFVVTSWKFCVDIKFYEDIKFYVHVIRFVCNFSVKYLNPPLISLRSHFFSAPSYWHCNLNFIIKMWHISKCSPWSRNPMMIYNSLLDPIHTN